MNYATVWAEPSPKVIVAAGEENAVTSGVWFEGGGSYLHHVTP